MSDNEMYVKNTFTIGGLFIVLIAMILGCVEIHKYQNDQVMKACVAAGKQWKVEEVSHSSNDRYKEYKRNCVNS